MICIVTEPCIDVKDGDRTTVNATAPVAARLWRDQTDPAARETAEELRRDIAAKPLAPR